MFLSNRKNKCSLAIVANKKNNNKRSLVIVAMKNRRNNTLYMLPNNKYRKKDHNGFETQVHEARTQVKQRSDKENGRYRAVRERRFGQKNRMRREVWQENKNLGNLANEVE